METAPRATKWHPFNRTRDDRGRVVDLFRAHNRAFEFYGPDHISNAEYASISSQISKQVPSYSLQQKILPGCALMFGLVSLPFVLFLLYVRNWQQAFSSIITIISGVIFWLSFRRTFSVGSRKVVREALLSHGRCASCGYKISDLEADDDGRTVCPECAAAWKVPAEIVNTEGAIGATESIRSVTPGRSSWKKNW